MLKKYIWLTLILGLLVGLSPSHFIANALNFDDEQNPNKVFPHKISMDIGGKTRVMVREWETPDVPNSQWPEKGTTPLQYTDWKQAHGLNFKDPRHLVFYSDTHSWALDGQQLTQKTYSLFGEGMRYIWTRNFELFTGHGNHAQIMNGDYALCVGQMYFDEHGLICRINNSTGHMCSIPIQLQQMVGDLHKLGALAPELTLHDYEGHRFSVDAYLSQEDKSYPDVKKVASDPALDERYVSYIQNADARELPVRPPSLASKVLDILDHKQKVKWLEESKFGPPHMPKVASGEELEKIEAQLKELHTQTPHGELYEQVLEVQRHASRTDHQVGLCTGRAAQILETDAEKKSAEEELRKLLGNIPHPELYAQLVSPIEYEYKFSAN